MYPRAINPPMDDMLMMAAGWLSRSSGSASLQPRNTLSTLTEKARCQSSRLVLSNVPPRPMPALFTSTDNPPSADWARMSASAHSSALVTSWRQDRAASGPKSAAIARACSAAASSLMSVSSTLAPSAASARAMAAPMPCAAPVTKAFLPARRLVMVARPAACCPAALVPETAAASHRWHRPAPAAAR